MNKTRLLLFGVTTMVVVLSTALVLLQPQERRLSRTPLPSPSPIAPQDALVEYKVGRVIRSSNEPHEVTVIISLEARHFARDGMLKLAHQLKQDVADVRILRVEILDDPNIADNYVPAGDMYRLFNKAKRGMYVLNRNTREEHIQFSTARGKPTDQVKIDLTKPN